MVGGKPTQDNSLRNYRHQLSWLCLERRILITTLLKAGRGKNKKDDFFKIIQTRNTSMYR